MFFERQRGEVTTCNAAEMRKSDIMMKRIALLAICAGCLAVAACNTISGAKEDAKSIGDTFSNATK